MVNEEEPQRPELIGQELDLRKIDLLADIEARQPNSAEIWYGHSILTSTLFPATQPAPDTEYVSKQNGSMEYMLEAGIDGESKRRRFPFGKYPRLIMSWMAKQIRAAGPNRTAYVDPEKHTITIPSIWQLCEDMGLAHGGRTTAALQDQLHRLLSCRISIHRSASTGFAGRNIHDTVYLPIVEAVRTVNDSNNADYSGAAFVLTEEVYKRLGNESAPYDTRASTFLLQGRSVLPYDIYVWLTGSMNKLNHDLPISWDWLYERFGDSLGTMQNFRATFRRALQKVHDVYPEANVTVNHKGITLHPSPTAVALRRKRQIENQ